MFWRLILCHLLQLQFSHSECCLFILFMVFFVVQKLFSLVRSHLFIFLFIYVTRGGGSQRNLLWFMSKSLLPMFSSKSFIVFGLEFRSLIHFEFIFVYGVRKYSDFILLHVAASFLSTTYWRDLCSPLCILASFVKSKVPWTHGFISGLSVLFHWSIFLFLCQYHTVLMAVAL